MADKSNTSPSWINRLKVRWGITSSFQVLVVLVIFACTGISVLYAEDFLYLMLGIPEEESFLVRVLIFVFITLPLYNIFLLIFGLIFGQFRFFWDFEKRFFARMGNMFRKKSTKP